MKVKGVRADVRVTPANPKAPHTCHVDDCPRAVPPEKLMCASHWRMVPKRLQVEVWKYYRAGQCDDRLVTYDYLIAARRAVNSVVGRDDDFDPFLQGLIGKREAKENIP